MLIHAREQNLPLISSQKKKMRQKIILILSTLFCSTILFAQDFDPVDDFRGVTFGTPIDQVRFDNRKTADLVQIDQSGSRDVYIRAEDNLIIGNAQLKNIYYIFNRDDELAQITLKGSDEYNEDMSEILENRLGQQTDHFITAYDVTKIWERPEVLVIYRQQRSGDFEVELIDKSESSSSEGNKDITDF